jgi:hypothetical protein
VYTYAVLDVALARMMYYTYYNYICFPYRALLAV